MKIPQTVVHGVRDIVARRAARRNPPAPSVDQPPVQRYEERGGIPAQVTHRGETPMPADAAEAIAPMPDLPTGGPSEVQQLAGERDDVPTPEQLAQQHYDTGATDVHPERTADPRIPFWMQGKFRWSHVNAFGSKWRDGLEHLVPEPAYIEGVLFEIQRNFRALEEQHDMRWWEVYRMRVEDPSLDIHEIYAALSESQTSDQQISLAVPDLWRSRSFGIRDTMTRSLAQLGFARYDLIEQVQRLEGKAPTTDQADRIAQADHWHERRKETAMLATVLWMDERETRRAMQEQNAPGQPGVADADGSPPVVTVPEPLNLRFAVENVARDNARYQEQRRMRDPQTVARLAASEDVLSQINV